MTARRVGVVGAGVTGLTAARALAGDARVVVLDAADTPGGRLLTLRRGTAVADAGAQFFTVREDAFAHQVARWKADGVPVRVWSHGFPQAGHIADGPDGVERRSNANPRYHVAGGMAELARHLARGLDVRLRTAVRAARLAGSGWRLETGDNGELFVDDLLITTPLPASLALLGPDAPACAVGALEPIRYAPCVALVVVLDGPSAVPEPGAVQLAEGPVSWLSDNARKGLSRVPALTVHAVADAAERLVDATDATVRSELEPLLAPWLGDARIVDAAVRRWRHARPLVEHPDRAVVSTCGPSRVAFAGDAFAEPRIEGAVRSGLAAAERLRS